MPRPKQQRPSQFVNDGRSVQPVPPFTRTTGATKLLMPWERIGPLWLQPRPALPTQFTLEQIRQSRVGL